MDYIYIVESEVVNYEPNFTMPGKDELGETIVSKINWGAITAGAVVSAATNALKFTPMFLPATLLASTALTSPLIYKKFSDGHDGCEEELTNVEAQEIEKFILKHGITKENARANGYRFPPGHPVVGNAYRLHPLKNAVSNDESFLYIPESRYDEILLEEREAELLRLLVDLGATKIEIQKKVSEDEEKSASINANVNARLNGSVTAGGTNTSLKNSQQSDIRSFEFDGKEWRAGDKLDRSKYAWLAYEPSWEVVVFGREQGGCTKATIEISESSLYREDVLASAEIKAKIMSFSGDAGRTFQVNSKKSHVINVDFSPVIKD